MQIPEQLTDISSDWLSEVLGTEVASCEVVDAHSGTTGRGVLEVRYVTENDLPPRLFVKLPPTDEMQKLYFGWDDGVESDKDESDEPPALEADLLGILRGLVKSDSARGQKCSREFKKAMVGNAEYKDASKAKIKTMRQKYAEAEVKTLRTERLSEESFEEVDWSKATYEPFDIILQQEGGPGSDENFEAAKNYCRWCVKKGGRWIKYMKRSNRLNYAYLKEGLGEEIKKKWPLRKNGDHEDGSENAVASEAGVALAAVASVAVATPRAKTTATTLADGKLEGSGVSPSEDAF